MKIIKLWADTYSTGLFHENGSMIYQKETSISEATWLELQSWVEEYDFIIPLDNQSRLDNINIIQKLDEQGIEILKKIQNEWPKENDEQIKFIYYSEGKMMYL